MELDFHTTAAFTGHRTYDGEAHAALRATVRRLYARGFRTFLCGMAVGFDLAAAEAVLSCRGGTVGDSPVAQSGSSALCGDTSLPDAFQPDASQPDASQSDTFQPDASQLATFQSGAAQPNDASQPGTAFQSGSTSDGKTRMTRSSAPTGNCPVCGAAAPDETPAFYRNSFPAEPPSTLRNVAANAPLSGLRLVAVVPFRGQEARFSQADRVRYRAAVAAADAVVTLAPAYHAGCYAVRNNYLVDHASLLVAWYDGSPGGTRYTVSRALRRGLEFVNLHPQRPSAPSPEPTLF